MFTRQSFFYSTIILVIIMGLISIVGCGPSKEQQQMSKFLNEYGQAVDKYVELNGNGDANALVEAKAKIEELQHQWSGIQAEMVGNVTPQVMQKLDQEYKTITNKIKDLPAST